MIEEVIELLASKLKLKEYKSRFFLIESGGYDMATSKFTIVLTSRGFSEKFFTKISNSVHLSNYLKKESENLSLLNKYEVDGIPEAVASGNIGGRYFLVEKFIEGRRLGSSEQLNNIYPAAEAWLKGLYTKTETSKIEPSELLKRVEGYVSCASEFFDIDNLLSLMEKISPQEPLRSFVIHGDFWHGNMIRNKEGKIFLTDFALSAEREPPVDVIDLLADYEFRYLLDEEKLSSCMSTFLTDSTDPVFFALYSMVRKLAAKLETRIILYDQYLVKDLDSSMLEIREAGILKLLIQLYSKKGSN
jgi:fructosamine-3-kinase